MEQSFSHINTLEECQWELLVYKKQYDRCKLAIDTGNWQGYPEALKGRKDSLKILKEIVELLESKIQRLS